MDEQDEQNYPPDAWIRLGEKAKLRREEMGLTQHDLASGDNAPSLSVISKIETARSTSIRRSTMFKYEAVLHWERGSFEAILRDPEAVPRELPDAAGDQAPPLRPVPPSSRADTDTYPSDLPQDDFLRQIWELRGSVEDRLAAIEGVLTLRRFGRRLRDQDASRRA